MVVDPLSNFPGYALRRASLATIAPLTKRLAELDLRLTEATVLLVVEANPGITQSDIGRLLDIARANMAPLAARLFDRDLIIRERVDGRSQGITLSESGRRLVKRVGKAVAEHEATLLAKIPREHQEAFLDALHALWAPQEGPSIGSNAASAPPKIRHRR